MDATHPHLQVRVAVDIPQLAVPPAGSGQRDCGLSPELHSTSFSHAIASLHRRAHQGGNQVIVRFHNGYGALISGYRLLEGIYEIAPLWFHGPGPDDYAFHFRSHVPDLTWTSEPDEIVGVCEQISRLVPPGLV
jgi:hypothetical protein